MPIQPADVCRALVAPARTSHAQTADTVERAAVLASIAASYFRLRRGLAILALAFPPVLWLASGARAMPGSISAYYHISGGAARDVFVGVLWTIGAFLFFYKGYSTAENRALNLAGGLAVVIAVSPLDWPPGAALTLRGGLHDASAIVFFLCIAYVCVRCSSDTVTLLDAARRQAFTRTYRLLGFLMIALPLGVAALRLLLGRAAPDVMVTGIEIAAIYVFAVFWLVKSREIALIERST